MTFWGWFDQHPAQGWGLISGCVYLLLLGFNEWRKGRGGSS